MHGQMNTRNAAGIPSTSTNLDNLKAHELRALAAKVDTGLTNGDIADANVKEYFAFSDKIQERLNVAQAREIHTRDVVTNRVSSPAIVRSVGDSAQGLAKNFSVSKAIVAAAEGRQLDGAEAEVTAEGRRQYAGTRGQVVIPNFVMEAQQRNVYGNDSGQSGVDANVSGRQTINGGYQVALHNQPLAEELGALVVDASGSSTMLIPFLGRTAAGMARTAGPVRARYPAGSAHRT